MKRLMIVGCMLSCGVLAGCEFPGSSDNSTEINAEGDVIIIDNSDGSVDLDNKPSTETTVLP